MANELQIANIDDVMRLSSIAMKSNYFGFRNPEEAAIKIMYGLELGLPAFQAMQNITVIQGKPTMGANLVASLIKRSGRYNYTIPVWDEVQCTISFTEHGKPVGESSFTMNDAKRAGLLRGGGNWEKFPRAMLFARALTQGARAYCADVFVAPVYDPEELAPDSDTSPPVIVEQVEAKAEARVVPKVTPVPLERQVHPLRLILNEMFPGNKDAMSQAMLKVYEQLAHNGTADGSALDTREMYSELVRLMDSGKVTPMDVKMMIQFEATSVLKEIEVNSADTGDLS